MSLSNRPTVAILGGTGDQGRGLAVRFAAAGVPVIIGSRDLARAEAAAAGVGRGVSGHENLRAASLADVVIVAVPWAGHAATVQPLREAVAGKVVIDCVNPLGFDKQGAFVLPVPEGSAAEQAQALLPESRVVAAFHHVSAVLLQDLSIDKIQLDVLVLGDDREATDLVQGLAELIPGVRGIFGGRLRNAAQVEGLTANIISINRRYRAHAGIRVTDV